MGKLIKLTQQSEDWFKWRHTGLGSSDAAAVLGSSPWKSPLQLLEEKARDEYKAGEENWVMQRGKVFEPIARNIYQRKTYLTMTPVTMEHDSLDYVKASLDGWNQSQKIPLEIKCPGKKDHAKALSGEIPEKYIPQTQHILAVTGASLLHYASYDGSTLALVEVKPDREYQQKLLEAETQFWSRVQYLKAKRVQDPNWQFPIDETRLPQRRVRRAGSL